MNDLDALKKEKEFLNKENIRILTLYTQEVISSAKLKELIDLALGDEGLKYYGTGDNWNVSDPDLAWKVCAEINEEDHEESPKRRCTVNIAVANRRHGN